MAEFSELIKRFDKIRDYMRDFYVYGFKSRADFTRKSARTYDNEKRRCESYLGGHMKWEYSGGNKVSFISVDCASIPINPLYAAWKSKSFTANDITLHFHILDALVAKAMQVDELTDVICEKSATTFDVQTVRNKCREYVRLGMLRQKKQGRTLAYSTDLRDFSLPPGLLDAIRFFQGAAPFGEIGSYLLDNECESNNLFAFKHYYITHTLENGVLFDLLSAIRQNRSVTIENHSERTGKTITVEALPLKIMVSTETGRRFVCVYLYKSRQFTCFRLDYIKSVFQGTKADSAHNHEAELVGNLEKAWGVSFSKDCRTETISIKLHIDAKYEQYIIDRIMREGRGGELTNNDDNTYTYTREVLASGEMTPWIKTFTGRIVGLDGSNKTIVNQFYDDIDRMAEMYGISDCAGEEGD